MKTKIKNLLQQAFDLAEETENKELIEATETALVIADNDL